MLALSHDKAYRDVGVISQTGLQGCWPYLTIRLTGMLALSHRQAYKDVGLI